MSGADDVAARIVAARQAVEQADRELRDAVRAGHAAGLGHRPLSLLSGLSRETIRLRVLDTEKPPASRS